MRPVLLILPLLSAHLHAAADTDDVVRVEIKATSPQQQRQQDNAGRIVVARDELLRYGDTSVADVLRRQSGIVIVDGAVQLRGLGGGRTQILLNGDPAPPGFSPDSLAPALIERIEILRSASADASTQGIAGSINIVLRKPTARAKSLATLAAVQSGAAWTPEATLDLSRAAEPPAGMFSAALAANAVRTRLPYSGTIDTQSSTSERVTSETGRANAERIGLTPRLNWKFDDGATLAWQGLFDLSRGDNHGRALEAALRGETSTYPRNAFDAESRTLSARSDASWNQRFGDSGRFEWKAGLAHNRRESDYLFTGSALNGAGLWQRHVLSNATDDSASTSGKWRSGNDSGHALALGWDGTLAQRAEWRRQEDADASGAGTGLLDQRYVAHVRRLALYAQDEWSPKPGLDVYAGLRWEHLRTQTDGADIGEVANHSSVLSPVAHLLWQLPDSRDQMRLALAHTYKAPATRDLVPRRYTINNDNGPTNPHFQGNPDLRPELAWGVDLAYETYFGKDSMLSASGYHRRIDDIILPVLFMADGEWVNTPRNAGRAVVSGVEFDIRAALGTSGATARATVSRNWSRVAAVAGPGNRLGEQTPLVLNAGMDYRLPVGATVGFNWNLQAGGDARTSSTQWNERGIVRRLDLYGRWQVSQAVALRITANNLLAPDLYTALRYANGGSDDTLRSTQTRSNRTLRIAAEIGL